MSASLMASQNMNNQQHFTSIALKISRIRDGNEIQTDVLSDLIQMIEQKKASQELIIKLLERKGLFRIYQLMSSANPIMRRLATKLMIELSYRNEKTQIILCEAFSFTPIKGQVALNPIPQSLQSKLKKDPTILMKIKHQLANLSPKNQVNSKFWAYPEFKQGHIGSTGGSSQLKHIDFYKQQPSSLDAISSAEEDEDALYQTNSRESIAREFAAKLMRDIPDPFEYIIGFNCTSSSESKRTTGHSPTAFTVQNNNQRQKQQESPLAEAKNFMSTTLPSNRDDNKHRPKTSENNYLLNYGSNFKNQNSQGRNSVLTQMSKGTHGYMKSGENSDAFRNTLQAPSDSNDQGYIKYQLTSGSIDNYDNPVFKRSEQNGENSENIPTCQDLQEVHQTTHQYNSNSTWNPRDLKNMFLNREDGANNIIVQKQQTQNLHKKNDSVIVSHKFHQQASPSMQNTTKQSYQSAKKDQGLSHNVDSSLMSPQIITQNQAKMHQSQCSDSNPFSNTMTNMTWEKQQNPQSLYQSINQIQQSYYNSGNSSTKKDKLSQSNRIKSPLQNSVGKASQSSSIGRSSIDRKYYPTSTISQNYHQQQKLQASQHQKKTSTGFTNTLHYSQFKESAKRDTSSSQRPSLQHSQIPYSSNDEYNKAAYVSSTAQTTFRIDESQGQTAAYKPKSSYVEYNPPSRSNKQSISNQFDIDRKFSNKTQVPVAQGSKTYTYDSVTSIQKQQIDMIDQTQYLSFNPNTTHQYQGMQQLKQSQGYTQPSGSINDQINNYSHQQYSSIERNPQQNQHSVQDPRNQGTSEKMDNLRRLSDSIKKKIQEQEYVNQQAKEKMKVKSIHLQQNSSGIGSYSQTAAMLTNATSSVGSSTRVSQTRQNSNVASSNSGIINSQMNINSYLSQGMTQALRDTSTNSSANQAKRSMNEALKSSVSPKYNKKVINSSYASNQLQNQYNKTSNLMSMISNQLSQKSSSSTQQYQSHTKSQNNQNQPVNQSIHSVSYNPTSLKSSSISQSRVQPATQYQQHSQVLSNNTTMLNSSQYQPQQQPKSKQSQYSTHQTQHASNIPLPHSNNQLHQQMLNGHHTSNNSYVYANSNSNVENNSHMYRSLHS
eukprot:403372306